MEGSSAGRVSATPISNKSSVTGEHFVLITAVGARGARDRGGYVIANQLKDHAASLTRAFTRSQVHRLDRLKSNGRVWRKAVVDVQMLDLVSWS